MNMRRACVGFSLLEILVAFVIMALALGVLMRVFSGALNSTAVAEHYAEALLIAESKLAAIGVETPLNDAEASGETKSGYLWKTQVVQVHAEADVDEAVSAGLFRVEVTVDWEAGGGKTRQVRLVSLRTGALP